MYKAILQFQDISGNWVTVCTGVDGNDQYISIRLDELQKRYAGKQVRAIERDTGMLILIR